jgi:hypothetical protein
LARFRAVRLALFRRVVAERDLSGVLTAHHANDQAETVLQRLLRGCGPGGLTGIARQSVIEGLTIIRPLLDVRRSVLREFLSGNGLSWREDPGNRSSHQQRNRVRQMLERHDQAIRSAIDLADACAALTAWLRRQSEPVASGPTLDINQLRRLPTPVAREAARRWLAGRASAGCKEAQATHTAGIHAVEIPPAAAERLLAMATDAATPSRQHFPGGILVRRRGTTLFTDASPAPRSALAPAPLTPGSFQTAASPPDRAPPGASPREGAAAGDRSPASA